MESGTSLAPALASPPNGAGGSPLVSILLVNFNGAKWLPACLDSLAAIDYPNREVIVVDNASSDNSLKVLAGYPWLKVVKSPNNSGFAGGNNLGLKHCSGRYVLLLNNDTVVARDFLGTLVQYLDNHPEVGIVQGKMVLPHFENRLDVCGSYLTAFGLPYHYGYYKPDGPKYHRPYAIFSAKGACMMFRRELIQRVGGFLFDEGFFCYYEETDFCHRAWIAGYETHFVPSTPIQHFMGGTAGGPQSDFVLRHYLRNMTFSLLSNLSLASRVRILPLFFAIMGASMLAAAVKLRRAQALAHWGALTHSLANYRKILARRRLIKRIRRSSDGEIFAKVLRTPRLEYFVKTFTGQLGTYVDDEVP
jgi:GT2 family glycosyltransferase